jgi:hypothetical protein
MKLKVTTAADAVAADCDGGYFLFRRLSSVTLLRNYVCVCASSVMCALVASKA